jgi:hypothetical protein
MADTVVKVMMTATTPAIEDKTIFFDLELIFLRGGFGFFGAGSGFGSKVSTTGSSTVATVATASTRVPQLPQNKTCAGICVPH